ncbi:DNA -binding domain-containing protein [Mesorhizobium sp. BHbdii]
MNRPTQTDEAQISELSDQVPWSDSLTAYDNQHFTIYLRLLDACADDASEEEMAQAILGIDPAKEPARARKSVRSHLDRVHWLVTTGYKELFSG